MLQICEKLRDLGEARLDDEVDKANLTLGDVRRPPIIELTHRELMHLLEVALGEELDEEEIGPEAAQVPWLCRIRNVRQVEHELDEDILACQLGRVQVFVLHARRDITQLGKVLGHVSSEHCLDYKAPDALVLFLAHVNSPVAVRYRLHDSK